MRLPLAILAILALLPAARGDLAGQIELAEQAGDRHATIELLRRWHDTHPGDQAVLRRLATLWLKVPDFDRAAELLPAISDAGFVARARADIADHRDGSPEAAIDILRARWREAPGDVKSGRALAEDLGKAGLLEEQIGVLNALIDADPDAALILDRAGARLGSDDPAAALADFRRAASIDPDGQRVQRERPGYERLEIAVEKLALLDKVPASPSIAIERAYWSLFGRMDERTLSGAGSVLKAQPDSASAKILEARALAGTGKIDAVKARSDYMVEVTSPLEPPEAFAGILNADEAVAARPKDTSARTDRAGRLAFAGQFLLANADIEQVLEASPDDIPALHLAVAVSRRLGNLPAATAHASRLEKLKAPRAVLTDVFTALGQMAFEQSNFPLALDFANRSLAVGSTPAAWQLKASCHARLGQPNEAAEAAKKADRP